MKSPIKLLYSSAAAAFFLLLQPLQAQAPAQPAAGSAAAADAADIQQQAADAFGKAVSAAARCDREELARQSALLESLNARMTQVGRTAAAGRRAARQFPTELGGAPEGDDDSIARAENAVFRLVTHARSLVAACGPETTSTAPPAEDIPTLEAEPAPPGFLDGYEGKGTISAPYPLDPMNIRLPPENGSESKAPDSGEAESAGGAAPPEKAEPARTPNKATEGQPAKEPGECEGASADGKCEPQPSGTPDRRKKRAPR